MIDGRELALSFVDAPSRGGVLYFAAMAVLPGPAAAQKKTSINVIKKRAAALTG